MEESFRNVLKFLGIPKLKFELKTSQKQIKSDILRPENININLANYDEHEKTTCNLLFS